MGREVADVTDVTLLIDDDGRTTYVGGVGVPLIDFGGVRLIFDDQAEKQWEAKLAAGGKKSIALQGRVKVASIGEASMRTLTTLSSSDHHRPRLAPVGTGRLCARRIT